MKKNIVIICLAFLLVVSLVYLLAQNSILNKYYNKHIATINVLQKSNDMLVKENNDYKVVFANLGVGGDAEKFDFDTHNYNKQVETNIKNYNLTKYSKQFEDYIFPVENPDEGYTASWFSEFTSRGDWFHRGMDFKTAYGTKILASKKGKVILVHHMDSSIKRENYKDVWGYIRACRRADEWYGNYIIIEHEDGMRTLYAHLSTAEVSLGDEVEQGQRIGLMGSTGNSLGPHLHFEIFKVSENKKEITYYNFVTESLHKRYVTLNYTPKYLSSLDKGKML